MLVFFNSASSYVQMSGNFPDLAMSQQSPRDWDHLDYEPEEVMEVEVEPAVTQGRSDEEVIQQILMESHSFSSSSSSEAGSGANTSGNPGPLGLSSSDVSFTSPSESSATVSSPTSASAAPSPDCVFSRTIKLMLARQKSSIYQHEMLLECAKITLYQQDMSH